MKIRYFLVVAVLATAILCFGTGASAQTTDVQALIAQLQAQIQSLLQQIAAIQAQQGTTQTWCHTFNTNLRIGDTGDEVDALKTALQKNGVYSGIDIGLPNFTEGVASAVSEFQEKYASEILAPYGLKRGTGFVGPSTRAKLNALYGCSTTQPSITVTSPNGGETLIMGQTYRIKWNSQNVDYISISLTDKDLVGRPNVGSGASISISGPISASSGYYDWKVHSSVQGLPHDGSGQRYSDNKYQINISQAFCTTFGITTSCQYGVKDSSDNYFSITSAATQPSITVTSPNGGETYKLGNQIQIKWTSSGFSNDTKAGIIALKDGQAFMQIAGLNMENQTPPLLSAGTYFWTIPSSGLPPGNFQIQIVSLGPPFVNGRQVGDMSDNYFSIAAAGQLPTASYVTLIGNQSSYTPGQTIKFSVKGVASDGNPGTSDKGFNVQAYIHKNNENSYLTPNPTGSYNGIYNPSTGYWDISMTAPSDTTATYTMKVAFYCSRSPQWASQYGQTAYCSESQVDKSFTFNIASSTQPSITVTSPNGGETLESGKTYEIRWRINRIDSSATNYRILLVPQHTAPDTITRTIYTASISSAISLPSNLSYMWTVPQVPGGNYYQIQIELLSGANVLGGYVDISDSTFTIISPSITVTSPNGGEVWKVGESRQITWSQSGLKNPVAIGLVDFSANTNGTMCIIEMNINSQTGNNSYQWTAGISRCSQNHTGNYKIIVYEQNSIASTLDYSDNYFSIVSDSLQPDITDGTMSDSNWTFTQYSSSVLATVPGFQSTGGNPGSYRKIVHGYAYSGTGGTGTFNKYIQKGFNPQIISSINMFLDSYFEYSNTGGAIVIGLTVYQGDKKFTKQKTVIGAGSWMPFSQSISRAELLQEGFDLSSSAVPIYVGFSTRNSTVNADNAIRIDNFKVNIAKDYSTAGAVNNEAALASISSAVQNMIEQIKNMFK